MTVDGKAIAADILESVAADVKKLPSAPRLSAITCASNFETLKYLKMKKEKAASVGVVLNVVELPADVSTKEVIDCVLRVVEESDGIVVQLPLPSQIDKEQVIAAVPVDKDPDGFKYENNSSSCFPPVVGAIDEISRHYNIIWEGKKVVIIGEGVLVGAPAARYARTSGAEVTVLIKENFDEELLASADIIVSGVGQPNLISVSSVKEGVVVFDAGTSEDGGVLVGDVDPQVSEKASFITPVPGGIGPITIAYLLRNLVHLANE